MVTQDGQWIHPKLSLTSSVWHGPPGTVQLMWLPWMLCVWLVLVNSSCQLDWIKKHPGNDTVHLWACHCTSVLPEVFNWRGKTYFEYGWYHPMGRVLGWKKTGKGENQLSSRILGSLLSELAREECLQEPLKPMGINWNSKTQSQILKIEFLRYFFKTTETYLHIAFVFLFLFFFFLLSCIKESWLPKVPTGAFTSTF